MIFPVTRAPSVLLHLDQSSGNYIIWIEYYLHLRFHFIMYRRSILSVIALVYTLYLANISASPTTQQNRAKLLRRQDPDWQSNPIEPIDMQPSKEPPSDQVQLLLGKCYDETCRTNCAQDPGFTVVRCDCHSTVSFTHRH